MFWSNTSKEIFGNAHIVVEHGDENSVLSQKKKKTIVASGKLIGAKSEHLSLSSGFAAV